MSLVDADPSAGMNVSQVSKLDGLQKTVINNLDEEIHKYHVVLHPAVFLSAVAFYVLTLTMGPKLMARRRPFDLKLPMMVYNIAQIVFNFWFLFRYFGLVGIRGLNVLPYVCFPVSYLNNFDFNVIPQMAEGLVFYYINKVLDLTETVFFVMRKKQTQITTLHVFHHLSMVISTYVTLLYAAEEIGVVMGALNAGIHLVMYIYYFLSGFGPEIRKYLWWKKYLTRMQMVQFLIMLACLFKMIVDRCNASPLFWCIWVGNVSTFLVLFYQFYSKFYRKSQ